MGWLNAFFGKKEAIATSGPFDFAIDRMMQSLCDMEEFGPFLLQKGLSEEAIWKIYNLTVLACAYEMLTQFLPKEQIPNHYIECERNGERKVMLDESKLYQRAKNMIGNYGQGHIVVATTSGPIQALNWCLNQLGPDAQDNIARIEILPSRLPSLGQADTKARIRSVADVNEA